MLAVTNNFGDGPKASPEGSCFSLPLPDPLRASSDTIPIVGPVPFACSTSRWASSKGGWVLVGPES